MDIAQGTMAQAGGRLDARAQEGFDVILRPLGPHEGELAGEGQEGEREEDGQGEES